MDGLIEPSMPKLSASVVVHIKDTGPQSQPPFHEGEQPDQRQNSFDEEDQAMLGLGGDKRRFSYTGEGKKSTPTIPEDTLVSKAKLRSRVHLTTRQKADIAQAFEAFDVTGTGYMSTVDLRVALRALGFNARKHEMKKILDIFDKGKTGRLCYADFMTIIEMKMGEDDTKEDIMKAFKLFDKDQVGHISFHNLRQISDELGEDVNDEEIAEMIAEADLDDDGTLDLEEFYKILKKSTII